MKQPRASDLSDIKARQKAGWAAGDYPTLGAAFVIISERLCEAVDLRAGQRVLDIATGSGNTALAAARRFCNVTGVDYTPAWLEAGRKRAAAEGLQVRFQEGDAEELPFPDASFDVVLSTLGVMFAPDQEKAVSELLRVCRPGGTIGLANWTPESFSGKLIQTTSRYLPPPPPNLKSPLLWGTEEQLRELLGDKVASLQVRRRGFGFRFRSERHFLEFMKATSGGIKNILQMLDAPRRESLSQDLLDLARRFNESGDETIVAPSDYLEAVATKK